MNSEIDVLQSYPDNVILVSLSASMTAIDTSAGPPLVYISLHALGHFFPGVLPYPGWLIAIV